MSSLSYFSEGEGSRSIEQYRGKLIGRILKGRL